MLKEAEAHNIILLSPDSRGSTWCAVPLRAQAPPPPSQASIAWRAQQAEGNSPPPIAAPFLLGTCCAADSDQVTVPGRAGAHTSVAGAAAGSWQVATDGQMAPPFRCL